MDKLLEPAEPLGIISRLFYLVGLEKLSQLQIYHPWLYNLLFRPNLKSLIYTWMYKQYLYDREDHDFITNIIYHFVRLETSQKNKNYESNVEFVKQIQQSEINSWIGGCLTKEQKFLIDNYKKFIHFALVQPEEERYVPQLDDII